MKHNLKLSPRDKPREWDLLEEANFGRVKVHEGFVFDGCSIPIGMRWLFPHGGNKMFGGCIHDYCYRYQVVTRKEADRIFYEAMVDNGVSKWRAKMMYSGVRAGGGVTWAKRRKQLTATQTTVG